jgi:hypothetical protein
LVVKGVDCRVGATGLSAAPSRNVGVMHDGRRADVADVVSDTRLSYFRC